MIRVEKIIPGGEALGTADNGKKGGKIWAFFGGTFRLFSSMWFFCYCSRAVFKRCNNTWYIDCNFSCNTLRKGKY